MTTTDLPLDFTVFGNMLNLLDLADTDDMTVEHVETALVRVGRNHAPELIAGLHANHALPHDAAVQLVGHVWSAAEYPDSYLDRADWRSLFDFAGFTEDGQLMPRPTKPERLYRGTVPERARDWSWTDDLLVAESYAHDGLGGRPAGQVFTCLAPPGALLARNNGRSEAEFVVDTTGLDITRDQGATA